MFPSMFNQTENGTTEGDSTHPKMEGGKERRKRGTAKNRGESGKSDGRLWELEADGESGGGQGWVAGIHMMIPPPPTHSPPQLPEGGGCSERRAWMRAL